MAWWRVTFTAEGQPDQVTEIEGDAAAEWVVVEAETLEEARRAAVRAYARRKVKERRAQLHAEGRCRCGRPQDRPGMLTCRVCAEGRQRLHQQRSWRSDDPPIVRDETARVEALRATQRDRRQEIRLETLLEVRDWWQKAPHTLAFAQRLVEEIKACGRAGVGQAGGS